MLYTSVNADHVRIYNEIASDPKMKEVDALEKKISVTKKIALIWLCASVFFSLLFVILGLLSLFLVSFLALLLLPTYYFTAKSSISDRIDTILRKVSDGKLNYDRYKILKSKEGVSEIGSPSDSASFEKSVSSPESDCGSDSESAKKFTSERTPVEPGKFEEKRKQDRLEVKRVVKTYAILGICKWMAVVCIVLLLALPLIKVDVCIDDANASFFDFIFVESKPKTFTELAVVEAVADFTGADSYEDVRFADLTRSFIGKIPSRIRDAEDVLLLLWVIFFQLIVINASAFVFFLYAVFSFISVYTFVKKLLVIKRIDTLDDYNFVRSFRYGYDDGRAGRKPKKFISFYLPFAISVFLFAYVPIKLLLSVSANRYITVSPILCVLCAALLVFHFVSGIITDKYYDKNSKTVDACDALKATNK